MEILREGKLEKKSYIFTCGRCGCKFIAEEGEWIPAGQMAYLHDGILAECDCPCCGQTVYKERN